MSYEVVIRGFNTQAEAEAFSSWYEGQGEQDISMWLGCRSEDGMLTLNSKHPYNTWENNQLILHVEPQ